MDKVIEDLQCILNTLDDAGQSIAAVKVAEAIEFLQRDSVILSQKPDADSYNEN